MIRIVWIGFVVSATPALGFAAATGPQAFVISWSGGDAPASRVDLGAGVVTSLGNTGFATLNAMALSPTGEIFAAGNNASLVRINPQTGLGTAVADVRNDIGLGTSIRGLAFSPSGVLFAINNGAPGDTGDIPDQLFTINVVTGVATLVGDIGFSRVQALDFALDGTLYGWDVLGAGLVRIDPATGASTDVNPLVGDFNAIQAIAFAPSGRLYGATNGPASAIVEINRATGVAAVMGPTTNLDIRGLAIVPEPSATWLALIPATVLSPLRRSVKRWSLRLPVLAECQ